MTSQTKTMVKAVVLPLAIAVASMASPALAAGPRHGPDVSGHHFPTHSAGVFLGGTDNGESSFTIGLEYEYRISQKIGVGVVVEHSPNAHGGDGTSLAMSVLHLHPIGGFRFTGGFGFEEIHGSYGKTNTVFRVGTAYEIPLGNFAIIPTVNLDFVGGQTATVFGFAFSRHF
ncbi:MAG: hypothetical protein JKX99_09840 [Robiginitomaculum sp.]|nr:hypothetical protein [Robiginitomaculum sp.]